MTYRDKAVAPSTTRRPDSPPAFWMDGDGKVTEGGRDVVRRLSAGSASVPFLLSLVVCPKGGTVQQCPGIGQWHRAGLGSRARRQAVSGLSSVQEFIVQVTNMEKCRDFSWKSGHTEPTLLQGNTRPE